jgi:hypothetical protein
MITNSRTVCSNSIITKEIHEPASQRQPVNPTTKHRHMNSPMDTKVAKGESRNLTRSDFLQCFQSIAHPTTHITMKIRLSGNAKKSAGNDHMIIPIYISQTP